MTHAVRLLGAALLLFSPFSARAEDKPAVPGVLVLAHGGTPRWDDTVRETVDGAKLSYPTEIVFGMGMHGNEVQQLQEAVSRLEAQGATSIVAVPLLVSSRSEVIRQLQYLLKLRPDGPWPSLKPVTLRVPVVMTQALDDDPAVADVLGDRIAVLSKEPSQEAVVLVAHGPTEDSDNREWLAALGRVAERLRQKGGFRTVVPVTMRDDASDSIRDAAIQQMRLVVREEGQAGRVLVVPVLIANGGVEEKIPERLAGLQYVYTGAALLPHPLLAQWIARRVHDAKAGFGGVAGKTLLQ